MACGEKGGEDRLRRSQDWNAKDWAAGKALGRGMARNRTQRGGGGESESLLGEAEEHERDDPSQHFSRELGFFLTLDLNQLHTKNPR